MPAPSTTFRFTIGVPKCERMNAMFARHRVFVHRNLKTVWFAP